MKTLFRIALHGVPRSGTSWLGQILNSSPHVLYKFQPLFSYELKDYLDDQSTSERISAFFRELETTSSAFLDQSDAAENGLIPRFQKSRHTHLVYKEVRYHHILENLMAKDRELRVVGLVRNPLAVMNSWIRAPREFRKDLGWDLIDEWRKAPSKNQSKPEEFFGFEKWQEATRIFESLAERHPKRFMLLRYDNLLQDPASVTRGIFEFCQLDVTNQTLDFIDDSRSSENIDPYSVFRKKGALDNEWTKTLDPRVIDGIESSLRNTPHQKYLGSR